MSEGKFKQEIRKIAEQDGKYANVETAFIRVGQVDKLLDEAKADFPKELLVMLQLDVKNIQDDQMKLLFIWFNKWFRAS
jgi:hypothetical protein